MRFVRTAENIWGLPAGFQRVAYLESTGTQYIDTGIYPTQLTKAKIEMQFTDVNYKQAVLGSNNGAPNDSGWNNLFGTNENSSTSKPTYFWCQWGQSFDGPVKKDANRHTHTFERNGDSSWTYTVDNTSKTITSGVTTQTSPKAMYLFACNNNGTVYRQAKAKVYYCKIWDNGVLIRDFIPCIDPLGVACMYDLVGKKPYYNQGTGTFTVGRQVIPVEYIESTGTQWLKTDYALTANTKIDVLFSPNQQTTANLWVIGSFVASNKLTGVRITSETTIDCYINTVISKTVSGSNIGNRYQAVLDGKWTVNDSEGTAVTVSAGLSPLILFGWNASTTANNYAVSGICSTKIYHCKIYDGSSLVRDFIPCKDENNVGFMFDKVSGTCYLNAGTGSFSVGENKYTSKLRLIRDAIRIPEGYTRVEYLESSGTQYIDTGYPIVTSTDEIVVEYENSSTINHKWLFGEYESNANFGITSYQQSASTIAYAYNGLIDGSKSEQYDTKHTLVVNSNGLYNDGVKKSNFKSYTATWNIYLFALNNTGTSVNGYFGYGKIYSYKHKRNGVLIRSFIPVRDSNNVGYMFDEVTGQMFGNAGSGSFGLGNDLPTAKVRFIQDVLPREYRPLKYLEGTGTQYIDMGVIFNESVSYSWEIYGQALNTGNTDYNWFIGTQTPWAMAGIYPDQSQYTFYPVGTYYQNGQVVSNTSGEKYSPVKHVLTQTGNSSNTLSLTLFARHNNNDGKSMSGTKRVFSCKISKSGNSIRDFYPALRKSDNKPGMYDRITKQFYVNQGTGEFSYE